LISLIVSNGRRLREGRCKDIDHGGGHGEEREGAESECVVIQVPSIEGAELGFLVESLLALSPSGVHGAHFFPFSHQSVIVACVDAVELLAACEFDGIEGFGMFNDFGLRNSHILVLRKLQTFFCMVH
jgi:hypothetical protein